MFMCMKSIHMEGIYEIYITLISYEIHGMSATNEIGSTHP